jgi:3'(2'), 5'-bisphosphate nucleotidase
MSATKPFELHFEYKVRPRTRLRRPQLPPPAAAAPPARSSRPPFAAAHVVPPPPLPSPPPNPLPPQLTGGSISVVDVARLAERAGRAVLRVYESDDFGAEQKGDGSPLTRADTASHAVLAAGLAELAPHVPLLSEEGGAQLPYASRCRFRLCWVVDPLDGTKEFLKRNGEFTVMVGLVQAEEQPKGQKGKAGSAASAAPPSLPGPSRSVLGAVHVPVTGQTYFAAEGQGAFVREGAVMTAEHQQAVERAYEEAAEAEAEAAAADPTAAAAAATLAATAQAKRVAAHALADQAVSTRPIQCASFRDSDPNLAIVASASHLSAETEAFCARFKTPTFSQVGSSLKMMRVAEGLAHVYPRLAPTMEWDTAAADVIVSEAGGKMVRCGACDGKTGRLLPGEEDWEAALAADRPLRYNKRNLLSPYFVCWGKRLL